MSAGLPKLPPRDPEGHKGTFGTVGVIGGCADDDAHMLGAPALAARAALRSGAGLVKIAAPMPIIDAVVTICPSATGLPLACDDHNQIRVQPAIQLVDRLSEDVSCLVVGPGLGSSAPIEPISLRCVQQDACPVVVDADAVNALARVPELAQDFRASAVLTPHPGEYARLAKSLNLNADPKAESSRPGACEALAQRLGCVVVLKGHRTVVSDGQRTWTNDSGTQALGTAGTGDVLSGLIAGLVAQFVPKPIAGLTPEMAAKLRASQGPSIDLYDAARIGVHAHGLASERWTKGHESQAGLLAMELADELPGVLETLR